MSRSAPPRSSSTARTPTGDLPRFLHRALTRIGAGAAVRRQAAGLLGGLHLRPVDAVLDRAAALDGLQLCSLRAIRLAIALATESPPTMVT